MLKNYLKTALRNLIRYRFFSFINIFGLAAAMLVSLILMMLVADQLSYDRHIPDAERIFRINSIGVDERDTPIPTQENASSPMPLGIELMQRTNAIQKVVRFRSGLGGNVAGGNDQMAGIPLTGFFADDGALELFQHSLEYGDEQTALRDPYALVLTKRAAQKLFKSPNPVGESIHLGKLGTFRVTGVLRETDHKSHIVFEALASMATVASLEQAGVLEKLSDRWSDCWNVWTYVQLKRGADPGELHTAFDAIFDTHIKPLSAENIYKTKFLTQRLLEITPGEVKNNQIGPQLPWIIVYILAGFASVVLLAAGFNFASLSIARSLSRAREIGVRKVAGASRWHVFTQFIAEAVLTSLFALMLALVMLFALAPVMSRLNLAQTFQFNVFGNVEVYFVFIAFAVSVGFAAGVFPALVLSGFQPVHVLKNLSNIAGFSRTRLRKVLLTIQFTISLFFILTVLIARDQVALFRNQDHGFNIEKNIALSLSGTNPETLKNELAKYPNIIAATATSHLPAAGTSLGTGMKRRPEDADFTSMAYFNVDEAYAENMELNVVAGHFFRSEDAGASRNRIVINEAAVSQFKLSSPEAAIGEVLIHQADSAEKMIVGVVKNYNHRTLTHRIEPLVLFYDSSALSIVQIRYEGSYDDACASIEKAWSLVNPGLKPVYRDLESEIRKFYDLLFGDVIAILMFVSFLALLLSCFGLLGMAMYATEMRRKEVSIRKILGSGNSDLVLLLSKGFLSILALSVVVGVPLAYFVNQVWLQTLAYRTPVGFQTIGLGVLMLCAFGFLSMASQVIRAAMVDPIRQLKND